MSILKKFATGVALAAFTFAAPVAGVSLFGVDQAWAQTGGGGGGSGGGTLSGGSNSGATGAGGGQNNQRGTGSPNATTSGTDHPTTNSLTCKAGDNRPECAPGAQGAPRQ